MKGTKFKLKLGHQCPRGYVQCKYFNNIELKDIHLYVFNGKNVAVNIEDEMMKLYNGEPCVHTDKRFLDRFFNFYKCSRLFYSGEGFSLKSAKRRIKRCYNLPKGTIVSIKTRWYYPLKNIDTSYRYKVTKENTLEYSYEVSDPRYTEKISESARYYNLLTLMRQNGFLCSVYDKEDDEISICYGHGKIIYIGGSVLYDYFGEFDKWSRAYEIDKDLNDIDILRILMMEKKEDDKDEF